MKKTIGTIIAVLAATLVLIGCVNKNQNKGNDLQQKDLFAVSAVTGINDIKMSDVFNNVVKKEEVKLSTNEVVTEELNDDLIEQDNKYLDLMLNILNNKAYNVLETESDDSKYKKLLNITINQETYLFYYNETLVKESIETEDDEYEEEFEYLIEGYILNNDIEYSVFGKKEVELEINDNDETEEELKLELKISLDDKNYSLIKYEYENELEEGETELEKELKFNTYKDGKLISKLNVKIEIEDNTTEIKLSIKEEQNIKVYTFTSKNNQQQVIKYKVIQLGKTTEHGKIEVELQNDDNGVLTYQYK